MTFLKRRTNKRAVIFLQNFLQVLVVFLGHDGFAKDSQGSAPTSDEVSRKTTGEKTKLSVKSEAFFCNLACLAILRYQDSDHCLKQWTMDEYKEEMEKAWEDMDRDSENKDKNSSRLRVQDHKKRSKKAQKEKCQKESDKKQGFVKKKRVFPLRFFYTPYHEIFLRKQKIRTELNEVFKASGASSFFLFKDCFKKQETGEEEIKSKEVKKKINKEKKENSHQQEEEKRKKEEKEREEIKFNHPIFAKLKDQLIRYYPTEHVREIVLGLPSPYMILKINTHVEYSEKDPKHLSGFVIDVDLRIQQRISIPYAVESERLFAN